VPSVPTLRWQARRSSRRHRSRVSCFRAGLSRVTTAPSASTAGDRARYPGPASFPAIVVGPARAAMTRARLVTASERAPDGRVHGPEPGRTSQSLAVCGPPLPALVRDYYRVQFTLDVIGRPDDNQEPRLCRARKGQMSRASFLA